MSIWSFPSSATQASTLSFGRAKKLVARAVGGQDNPDEFGATDAIRLAINEMNRHRWEFLTVRGSDIPIVSGTGTYTLPSPFKDPLSLIVDTGSGTTRTLTYIPRGKWDPLVENQDIGGTWFYTNFNQGLSGNVELLDAPDFNGTMEIRYYRPIAFPASDSDALDVQAGPAENALLALAQLHVAGWRGLRSEKLALFENKARMALNKAMGDDVSHADYRPQMIPGRLWARRPVNPNSVWPYIDGWW